MSDMFDFELDDEVREGEDAEFDKPAIRRTERTDWSAFPNQQANPNFKLWKHEA